MNHLVCVLTGVAFLVLGGCASKTAPAFSQQKPVRIAVIPPVDDDGQPEGARILRALVILKLREKGYEILKVRAVDEALQRKFPELEEKEEEIEKILDQQGPVAVAKEIKGCDAFLVPILDEWDRDMFPFYYDGLDVDAGFVLYSCKDGEWLWKTGFFSEKEEWSYNPYIFWWEFFTAGVDIFDQVTGELPTTRTQLGIEVVDDAFEEFPQGPVPPPEPLISAPSDKPPSS